MVKYVLITAARNESAFIERTLVSVVAQTQLPEKWVIMDDGSTDETAAIVAGYAEKYPWIHLFQRQARADRSFAGKAHAVNAAFDHLQDVSYDVVGNLDADVSFKPDYLAFVMGKFADDMRLGVAGTPFTEVGEYDSARDSFEGQNYVAGPCQLFRRACWDDIGGYVANKAGGVDWIAVMTARMKGWNVQAFPEMRFHHHRSMGTAQRTRISSMFSYGEKDYYLGNAPSWQLFRCAYRILKRPYLVGGIALFAGYCSAAVRRMPRAISPELLRFHRAEQMKKLRAVFASLLRFGRVEKFSLATDSK
jgi:glycosyltransferase involved in cell wall biosynthesis